MRLKFILVLLLISIQLSQSLSSQAEDQVDVSHSQDTEQQLQDENLLVEKENEEEKQNKQKEEQNQSDSEDDDQKKKKKQNKDEDKKEDDGKHKNKKNKNKKVKSDKNDKSEKTEHKKKQEKKQNEQGGLEQIESSITNIGSDILRGFNDAFDENVQEQEFITYRNIPIDQGIHQINQDNLAELDEYSTIQMNEDILELSTGKEESAIMTESNKNTQEKQQNHLNYVNNEKLNKNGNNSEKEDTKMNQRQEEKNTINEPEESSQTLSEIFNKGFDSITDFVFQKDKNFESDKKDEQLNNISIEKTSTTDVEIITDQISQGLSDFGNKIINPEQLFVDAEEQSKQENKSGQTLLQKTQYQAQQETKKSLIQSETLESTKLKALENTSVHDQKQNFIELVDDQNVEYQNSKKFLKKNQKKKQNKDCGCGGGSSSSSTIKKPGQTQE